MDDYPLNDLINAVHQRYRASFTPTGLMWLSHISTLRRDTAMSNRFLHWIRDRPPAEGDLLIEVGASLTYLTLLQHPDWELTYVGTGEPPVDRSKVRRFGSARPLTRVQPPTATDPRWVWGDWPISLDTLTLYQQPDERSAQVTLEGLSWKQERQCAILPDVVAGWTAVHTPWHDAVGYVPTDELPITIPTGSDDDAPKRKRKRGARSTLRTWLHRLIDRI